jgi:sugar lactone lactonase YvrE
MRNLLGVIAAMAMAASFLACTAAAVRAEQRAVTDAAEIAKVELPATKVGPAAGKRDEKLEVVALVYGPLPAGVAVSRQGRVFLTFPRWSGDARITAAELLPDGKLVAFPNEAAHDHKSKSEDRIESAQGIDIDAKGRVWLLDVGQAKLRGYDPASGDVVKRIALSPEVLKINTYANDVRVDLARGTEGFAYISDTAGGGVIVVDLASGDSWRRLTKSKSGRADPDVTATVEGKRVTMRGHVDGIALSPDGKTLYYHGLSRRDLWAVGTDALANRDAGESVVEMDARKVADSSSCADGIGADGEGRVYTTDYEDHAIRRIDPATGKIETVVQDERILWPDAVWVHGGYVYFTTNQLNRSPRTPPYGIFRYPVDGPAKKSG